MTVIDPEKVAYWFFRLNGCLTIENFVVHPEVNEEGGSQRTEADILAVRYPHRAEFAKSGRKMVDDSLFNSEKRTDFIIAEVKRGGPCRLNGPWKEPDRKTLQRVLYAMGWYPENCVESVADVLSTTQLYRDDNSQIRLFAIGASGNPHLNKNVVQITWEQILKFIHRRFSTYVWEKSHHPQWDDTGQELYRISATQSDVNYFVEAMLQRMGIESDR